MNDWWVDCCCRLFYGNEQIPVDRDLVHRVLGERGIDVAISAWLEETVALEILDRAGTYVRSNFARRNGSAA